MKKFYSLLLSTLLLVVGGVEVEAQTTKIQKYEFYQWSRSLERGDNAQITDGGTNIDINGESFYVVPSFKFDDKEWKMDSRLAVSNNGNRGSWWVRNAGGGGFRNGNDKTYNIAILNLFKGDKICIEHDGGEDFLLPPDGIPNIIADDGGNAPQNIVSNTTYTVQQDGNLVLSMKSANLYITTITIEYDEENLNLAQYTVTKTDEGSKFSFTSPGILKNRTITDVPHMIMTFGNTEINNRTTISDYDWTNDNKVLGATIYRLDGINSHLESPAPNGSIFETTEYYQYYQGTFYMFKPSLDGELIIEGINENGGPCEFSHYYLEEQEVLLAQQGPCTLSRSVKAGLTYIFHAAPWPGIFGYDNDKYALNVFHLTSFTFKPAIEFEKQSDVVRDGSNSYTIENLPNGTETQFHLRTEGNITNAQLDPATGKVTWDQKDGNKPYGGAIIVIAEHSTATASFVITVPYEVNEWVFDKTEDKEHLYLNTSIIDAETGQLKDGQGLNKDEWELEWKVYHYNDTKDENGKDVRYYTELERPVFSNSVEIQGDNARFIDATAGLLFEAPDNCFGTNTTVTPYYEEEKDSNGNTYRVWGREDKNEQKVTKTSSELSEYLQGVFKDYKIDSHVIDDELGDAVTIKVGTKMTIPNLLPGQHIRIRWNRHNPSIGELVRATNVTDLDGKSMDGKVFNLGSGSHNSKVGHQEFIVENSKNTGNTTERVDVTFELLKNQTVLADGTVISGQSGWANIFNIKVGPVGEFLETHMNTVFVDDKEPYDSEAEIITRPEKVSANTNIDELDENGNIHSDYKRDGIYNYLRKSGKGIIKTKLDLYPENIDVINGSQIETYKIVEGSYTGTLNSGNCNVREKQTETFLPLADRGDYTTERDRNFQYLYIVPSNGAEEITNELKNAELTNDNKDGWKGKNTSDAGWKTDGNDSYANVVEFYETDFNFYQSVTLPAGKYRVEVNAFFRNGEAGDGKNPNKARIYVKDSKEKIQYQNIVALTSAGIQDYNRRESDLLNASRAFSNGYYPNYFDFSLESDQTIDLGLQGEMASNSKEWCIFGPVKLYKYTEDNNTHGAHGSFTLALESRQIVDYNYCKDDFLLDSVHVKVNVYEYDYNVKPYPYTWAMEHFTKETGNKTEDDFAHKTTTEIWDKDEKGISKTTTYWTNGSGNYQFNIGYPENMIAWKKRTAKGGGENVTYAMKEGERMVSGQTVPVRNSNNENEVVATVTFGERCDGYLDDAHVFKPAVANNGKYYTPGNNLNGGEKGGTFYTIIPKYNGTITVSVNKENQDPVIVRENGVELKTTMTNSDYTFPVKESQHYKIYAENSKLGFYGLTYDYTTGGELYVPEMDGLGIIPAKYWDKDDKTITLEPKGKGLTLAYNNGGNTSDDTSTEPKGHTLIVPNLKKGNTVYFAATGNGSITEATKTYFKGKIDGNTEVDIYKYVATQDEGKDVQFVIKDLNIYKVAVSVDNKSVSSVGYATEAREYPLDFTLANTFLGREQNAYIVTDIEEKENKSYVTPNRVSFVPQTIDNIYGDETNGVVITGDDSLEPWALFTTDVDRATSDMTGNKLIGVVAQANVATQAQDDNGHKYIDQEEKISEETYYNYLLATSGYKVEYFEETREGAKIETDKVIDIEKGLGFYLVLAKGTEIAEGVSHNTEEFPDNRYKGGLPKNNSAYLRLPKRLARINDFDTTNADNNVNAAKVHQVFFIDVDSLLTGIDEVLVDDEELPVTGEGNHANLLKNGVFYTLQGIPVKNPTKGIYIFNGKKVYVK